MPPATSPESGRNSVRRHFYIFVKAFGEKGDEPQLISLLNAVLKSANRNPVTSVEIIENKELPADIIGGKAAKLDTRAIIYDGTRTNIEIQIKNEYNMYRKPAQTQRPSRRRMPSMR